MGDTIADTTVASITDLSAFQRDMLRAVVLAEDHDDAEGPYGLGIKSWLGELYGEDINHSRLYPNLDALEEKGLIEREAVDKRTDVFYLTDDGRDVLRWFSDRYAVATADGVGE